MPIGKKFGAMQKNGIGPLLISHRYKINLILEKNHIRKKNQFSTQNKIVNFCRIFSIL